tara:strand:- start:21 stop:614 length:594 start_codon:yes stop_codon:yes gene_type:complete
MSQGNFARASVVSANSFLTHDEQVTVVEVELASLADREIFVEPGVMERNHGTESNPNDFSSIGIPMVCNATLRDIRVVISLTLELLRLGADEVLHLFSHVFEDRDVSKSNDGTLSLFEFWLRGTLGEAQVTTSNPVQDLAPFGVPILGIRLQFKLFHLHIIGSLSSLFEQNVYSVSDNEDSSIILDFGFQTFRQISI